MAKISWTV